MERRRRPAGSVTVTSAAGESGWQVGTLSAPIAIQAGATYVVSYGTTQNYAATANYFTTAHSGPDGVLTAGVSSGVFAAGTPGVFPTASYNASNYWVDVTFIDAAEITGTWPVGDREGRRRERDGGRGDGDGRPGCDGPRQPRGFVAQTGDAQDLRHVLDRCDGCVELHARRKQRRRPGAEQRARTLHELVTVATADGTTQVIDITINGANDAAVITGTATGRGDREGRHRQRDGRRRRRRPAT